LAIATKDFDGDEMIWTRRTFLPNPKPLPDDGPIVAYRQWCERFWPPDYLPDAPDLRRGLEPLADTYAQWLSEQREAAAALPERRARARAPLAGPRARPSPPRARPPAPRARRVPRRPP